MKKIIFILILFIPNTTLFGQGWQDVGNGVRAINKTFTTGVHVMCSDTVNHLLYVGGTFDTAGVNFCENVGAWDGTNWYVLPIEQGAGVDAMVMYKGNLYVGGSISNTITPWNGTTWLPGLPSFNGGVNALCVFNDTLYAGGSFTKSKNTTLNYIAKWDGVNWIPVGNGFTGYASPSVNALCVWNGKLYAGGFFDMSGSSSNIFSVAEWDSGIWKGLGRGVSDYYNVSQEGSVYAMDTFQNNLYVGGNFGFAGGDTIRFIAKWDGNKWNSLGNRLQADVDAMVNFDTELYIGGLFDNIDGFIYRRIAQWDGLNMTSVDSGLDGNVWALANFQNQLYVGGIIDTVGYKNLLVNNIARWSPTTTDVKLIEPNSYLMVFPNPTSGQLTFTSSNAIQKIEIEDVLGQTIMRKAELTPLQKESIDVSALSSGIYFYKLITDNLQNISGKFVKN